MGAGVCHEIILGKSFCSCVPSPPTLAVLQTKGPPCKVVLLVKSVIRIQCCLAVCYLSSNYKLVS